MEFFHTALEAHACCATLYITGFLTDGAASRAAELLVGLPDGTRIIRLDLRAVDLIDPRAFVAVARTLGRWRDARRGRVTIEFPQRASRPRPTDVYPAAQLRTTGMAVSTAMT